MLIYEKEEQSMVKRITDEMLAKLLEKDKNRIFSENAKIWDSDDLRILAYYQLKEEMLMVAFGEFYKGK